MKSLRSLFQYNQSDTTEADKNPIYCHIIWTIGSTSSSENQKKFVPLYVGPNSVYRSLKWSRSEHTIPWLLRPAYVQCQAVNHVTSAHLKITSGCSILMRQIIFRKSENFVYQKSTMTLLHGFLKSTPPTFSLRGKPRFFWVRSPDRAQGLSFVPCECDNTVNFPINFEKSDFETRPYYLCHCATHQTQSLKTEHIVGKFGKFGKV